MVNDCGKIFNISHPGDRGLVVEFSDGQKIFKIKTGCVQHQLTKFVR